MHSITTRLAQRLLDTPLIRNSIRGELVEERIAVALEPEWQHCAGDWAAFELKQAAGPLRIQVKQSAAPPSRLPFVPSRLRVKQSGEGAAQRVSHEGTKARKDY